MAGKAQMVGHTKHMKYGIIMAGTTVGKAQMVVCEWYSCYSY